MQRDIHEIGPTFFGAVPRIAEKMQAGVEIKMQDAAWLKRRNYALWMRVGRRLARERIANGGRLGLAGALQYRLGDLLLYRAMRSRLGLRRVTHCLVGAAPPSPELLEYFHAIGVPMVQTYGQTECGVPRTSTTAGTSPTTPSAPSCRATRAGSTPTPTRCCSPATAVRRLLAQSEATANTIKDGWLHTGDCGQIQRSHLKIVGRIRTSSSPRVARTSRPTTSRTS